MTPRLEVAPRLVSVEGGEGAGKSTMLAHLEAWLRAAGEAVVRTREPGGTPLAERIRNVLLDAEADDAPSPETELLLMFAARAQHVQMLVQPALRMGAWVLSDRFTDASHAYQGGGRGVDGGTITRLEERFVGVRPGLTLLLDLPVATGRERAAGRGAPDRIEREDDAFFERIAASYRGRAAAEPGRWRVLDATQSAAEVARRACVELAAYHASLRA